MKLCWFFVYLISTTALFAQQDPAIRVLPDARIVHTMLDTNSVTVLRLKPGYVSSVRVPDDLSSVVLGNPGSFKAEHSEAEPRLVFLKPITSSPSETNALITTKTGREISLHLMSTGTSDRDSPVDFVLDYSAPRGFLVNVSRPSFVVADTRSLGTNPLITVGVDTDPHERTAELLRQESKELRSGEASSCECRLARSETKSRA